MFQGLGFRVQGFRGLLGAEGFARTWTSWSRPAAGGHSGLHLRAAGEFGASWGSDVFGWGFGVLGLGVRGFRFGN